jgi:hypothetical protein
LRLPLRPGLRSRRRPAATSGRPPLPRIPSPKRPRASGTADECLHSRSRIAPASAWSWLWRRDRPISAAVSGRGEATTKVPTEVERSAHAASSQHACAVCGRPRSARRRETCSDRCRTALSRKRCQEALQKRDEEIRTTLEVIMRLGQAVLARLGSAAPPQEARRALGSDDLSPTGAPLPSRAGPTPPSPYLPSCAPAASVEAKIRV